MNGAPDDPKLSALGFFVVLAGERGTMQWKPAGCPGLLEARLESQLLRTPRAAVIGWQNNANY